MSREAAFNSDNEPELQRAFMHYPGDSGFIPMGQDIAGGTGKHMSTCHIACANASHDAWGRES